MANEPVRTHFAKHQRTVWLVRHPLLLGLDRKSTRLNSSHSQISYAVFCLKKKNAPTLQATFVWDDTALVLRDPLIRSWRLIPEGFQRFLFVDATPSNFYRPVQRLSYTLEYWAFAFRPAPYHLTNVLLHAATAIALFIFALAFLRLYQVDERKSLGVAAVASLAWALHPLHSGVVDYVAGRADSLAALF